MTRRELFVFRMRKLKEEIEQIFTDAEYWNSRVRKAGEPKIDPDPDGELGRMLKSITASLAKEKEG